MANIDVIRNFLAGDTKNLKSGNLSIRDGVLYTYDVALAFFDRNGNLIVNGEKYSQTSSTHRNMVIRESGDCEVLESEEFKALGLEELGKYLNVE